jgi:hypothetical protein
MTRCRAALFLRPHEPLMSQKRDTDGELAVPHALVWDCLRCGRRLGETTLFPIVRRRVSTARGRSRRWVPERVTVPPFDVSPRPAWPWPEFFAWLVRRRAGRSVQRFIDPKGDRPDAA